MGSSPIWSMTACILSLITGGEDHGEFAGYRYGKDGTEHWKVAEAGRIVSKGSAGYFRICHTAGHIQVAAGRGAADHRQSGGACSSPAGARG